jgi:L-threonylcarbamoyladenylate synthase
MLGDRDAACLRERVAAGGVVVFPADTVYGLGCDPDDEAAVCKLYTLKGRPPERPAAVMFFALDAALNALPELGPRARAALRALLPGPLTLLLPNPEHRYPLACSPARACASARPGIHARAPSPAHDTGSADLALDALGLRVPLLPDRTAALSAYEGPLLQSSANRSGEPDCQRLSDMPAEIRQGADLVLDGGELPGIASTVLDLRDYERSGDWRIVREGPLNAAEIGRLLG